MEILANKTMSQQSHIKGNPKNAFPDNIASSLYVCAGILIASELATRKLSDASLKRTDY